MGWKKALIAYADIYLEANNKITDRLVALDDRELKRIIKESAKPTKTNCWWVIYWVAPQVQAAAKAELYRRQRSEEGK